MSVIRTLTQEEVERLLFPHHIIKPNKDANTCQPVNTVTKEEVQRNMQNYIVRTEVEFGKPTTYVTVQMLNGFTIRESTTCVDPKNYSEEIGAQICLRKLEDKVWFLLGYALQEKLSGKSCSCDENQVYQDGYEDGHSDGYNQAINDLSEQIGKLKDIAYNVLNNVKIL